MKKLSIALLVCSISLNSLQALVVIGDALISKPSHLRELNIALHNKNFYVRTQTSDWVKIEKYNIKGLPENLTDEQLINFHVKGDGYLRVRIIGDELGLEVCNRLRGGGPLLGVAAGWAVRALGYGTVAATAAGAVMATGGAAAAALGVAGGGAAVSAGAVLAGEVALATAGTATLGAATTGAAIIGGGLATEAALATTVMATSAGGIVGFIEGLAIAAQIGCTAIVWLP